MTKKSGGLKNPNVNDTDDVLGVSSRTSFMTFLCLRTAPHYRAPEAKGKQLAVFQVLDHTRDRFLACGSNSTSKIHEAQEFFEHLCHY